MSGWVGWVGWVVEGALMASGGSAVLVIRSVVVVYFILISFSDRAKLGAARECRECHSQYYTGQLQNIERK